MRFAIAWDLPVVEFGAGRRWWRRYTKAWGRSGTRAVDLAPHALAEAPAWRRAIEAWQAPYLDDPARPDWYAMALFNELYFLVDGGSSGRHGEVGRPGSEDDDVGRFALLECMDYPFYDTVDVDFYASFALLEVFPELEQRGIRDLLAAIPVDLPEIVTDRGVLGLRRAQGGRDRAPRRRRAPGRSVHAAELVHVPGGQRVEGLGPNFVLQAFRRDHGAAPRRVMP